jgi:hypothetical protein
MRSLVPSASFCSRAASLIFGLIGMFGCATEDLPTASPITDPDAVRDVFWAVQLNHRAALLSIVSPYDTMRLTTTPVNMAGEPMAGLAAPVYTSSSPDLVSVNSAGKVQALAVGSNVRVISSITVGNVTRSDTLFVNVVNLATPPVLTGFEADPVPPDSAKVPMTNEFTVKPFQARATDQNGNPMAVPVYYATSDASILSVHRTSGALGSNRKPGHVRLSASTYTFGVAKTDTVPYRVGLSLMQSLFIVEKNYLSGPKVVLEPTEIQVEAGATLRWYNLAKIQGLDVLFADPTNVVERSSVMTVSPWCPNTFLPTDCGRGDIINMPEAFGIFFASAEREIVVPGVYDFHIPKIGASGRIIVVASDVLP